MLQHQSHLTQLHSPSATIRRSILVQVKQGNLSVQENPEGDLLQYISKRTEQMVSLSVKSPHKRHIRVLFLTVLLVGCVWQGGSDHTGLLFSLLCFLLKDDTCEPDHVSSEHTRRSWNPVMCEWGPLVRGAVRYALSPGLCHPTHISRLSFQQHQTPSQLVQVVSEE